MTPERMQEASDHCSMTERRADEATRDVVRWLKAEYMMEHIGGEFDGIISGVTNFGIFVELANIFIDGLVHITALGNDYFQYDQPRHQLIGERSHQKFRLGDAVRVKVVRVSLEEGRIDFELAGAGAPVGGRARPARSGKQQHKPDGQRKSRSRRRRR